MEEDIAKRLEGFTEAPMQQLEQELAKKMEARGIKCPKLSAFRAMPVSEDDEAFGRFLKLTREHCGDG